MEYKKTKIIFGLFIFAYIAIVFKALKIQVLDKEHLLAKASKQFLRERKVFPRRGHIYDRAGNPLAINVRTYSIFAIPKDIKSDETYAVLEKIVPGVTAKELKKSFESRGKFTWIARKVKLAEEHIETLKNLEGIHAEEIPKRMYPNHELASQVLGFVGLDNDGLSGIEKQFDKELLGQPQIIKYLIDNKGRPVKYVSEIVGDRAEDLYLSIDKDLQAYAEKQLKEVVDLSEAFRGGVGVMNVETGEILAMANYPSFDPNDLSSSENIHRKLSFVSDPFEPGSTFKALTIASALENNIVRPSTNYYCEQGRLKVENHYITEAESRKKYEWLSVSEIMQHSSNVGTTKIAFDLTFPKLRQTLELFKIGEKTGIEIPGESRGIFTSDKNVSPLSLSNISFGQGVATTGLQMLAAYAAIANGGEYVTPTLLRVTDPAKIKKQRILSEKTVKELQQMLLETVEIGTGGNAKIPFFKIAGKTSTAQRADGAGSYSGYIPGFIGFPLDVNNKFVVYVYVDNPAPGKYYYGNLVAAPVFKKITEFLLFKNKEFEKLAENSESANAETFDSVKVVHSSKRHMGAGRVPNFIGLDKRSSSELAEKLGIDLGHNGVGVVKEQFPEPGSEMTKNGVVKLKYAPPTYE